MAAVAATLGVRPFVTCGRSSRSRGVQRQPVYVIRDERNILGNPGHQIGGNLMSRVCAFQHRWDAEDVLQNVEAFKEFYGKWPTIGPVKDGLELYASDDDDPIMIDYLDLRVEEDELAKLKTYCHMRGLIVDVIGRRTPGLKLQSTTYAPRPTFKQYKAYLENLARNRATDTNAAS